MTIFNSRPNRELEKGLEERALAGSLVLNHTGSGDTNELIMYTLQTLEFIKRAYDEGNEEVYGEFIEDGKFNDKVQYLIDNSPAAINPNFVDIPIEELPTAIIEHYYKFMGVQYSDGYVTIDPREIAKEHFDNFEEFKFYDTMKNFKYLINDNYRINRANLPVQPVCSLLGNINELYNLRERISSEYIATNIIKVKSDEMNYNAFMHLYEFYYFDLYMKTFYANEMEVFNKFRTIKFVDIETEGAITFDELSEYKADIGSLKEYIGLAYYQYRLDKENGPARRSMNCRLNNRKLNEIGFVFGETDEEIIDFDYISSNIINTMYSRNIQGYQTEYERSTTEMLNNLPTEAYEMLSKNFKDVLGITNLYDFTYSTNAVMSNVNQVVHDFKESLEPNMYEQEEFDDKFGYLAYADEIEEAISRTVATLENEIAITTTESE